MFASWRFSRGSVFAIAVIIVFAGEALAQEKKSESAAAYDALLKRAESKPANVTEAQWHKSIASELEKFAIEYANEPEAADARRNRLQQLQDAVRTDPSARPAFLLATDAVWKDSQADLDERANARLLQLLLENNDNVPANELLTLWKEFPGSDTVAAAMAIAVTETVDGDLRNKMLLALRDTPGTPENRRTFAKKILSGEVRPLAAQVGKPFSLRFKGLDGHDVELEKLRGHVVLIDFWATWCGPCIAEMPQIKQLYDQFHSKGLEIVGINFDAEKAKLENYIRKENITWAQYFDGKMWGNEIGKGFGLRNLPTVALVDKRGILRFTNARNDFPARVKELLAEQL